MNQVLSGCAVRAAIQQEREGLQFTMLRAAVEQILRHPHNFRWTRQGLGMLRTYLSKSLRLHVWSTGHQAPDVSTLHDHPWDFVSTVIAGRITNELWTDQTNEAPRYAQWDPYMVQKLRCGEGGGVEGDPALTHLRIRMRCPYTEGMSYEQQATDIHNSLPDDGTVTIIARTFREDTEHARVFWPAGQSWGTAEPRSATADEVEAITAAALLRWFA